MDVRRVSVIKNDMNKIPIGYLCFLLAVLGCATNHRLDKKLAQAGYFGLDVRSAESILICTLIAERSASVGDVWVAEIEKCRIGAAVVEKVTGDGVVVLRKEGDLKGQVIPYGTLFYSN